MSCQNSRPISSTTVQVAEGSYRESLSVFPVFYQMPFSYSDILSLPIPEILYCHYSGDEVALVHAFWQLLSTTFQKHDAFVMENLVASGEKPFERKLFHKNLQNMLHTS